MGNVKLENCLQIELTSLAQKDAVEKADVIKINDREFIAKEKVVEMMAAFNRETVTELNALKEEINTIKNKL